MSGEFDLDALHRRLASAPDGAKLKPIGLQAVLLGDGVLEQLADVVAGLTSRSRLAGPVALLTGPTPKKYGSGDLLEYVTALLSSTMDVRTVTLGGRGQRVHADEATLEGAAQRCEGAGAVVAVGSGTIADIGKMVVSGQGIPYAVVQTANSVNGFTDDRSVLLINGVKRTKASTWPNAVVVDTDVLSGTPVEMNLAGVGDSMAMFTAPADWYLATVLGMGDSYSASVVSLTRDLGPTLLQAAPRVPGGDRAALLVVANTLTLSGISMGVAGTTSPCSGMEHVVSHMLEMASMKSGTEPALHGAQVGASSVLAALVWQRVLEELADGGLLRARAPEPAQAEARIRAAFLPLDPSGEMAQECWRDYKRKLARWAQVEERVERVAAQWPSHERVLRELLAEPIELAGALRTAGAPAQLSELTPPVDDGDARWAVGNCHLMRDRFSVADMACFLGIWGEADVEALFSQAGALAGAA